MIWDEVADIMAKHSIGEIRRLTGLRKNRIYDLRCGCTFRLDYDIVNALSRLGYEFEIKKKSEKTDS